MKNKKMKQTMAVMMSASVVHSPTLLAQPSATPAPPASDANSKMKFKDASIEDITNENFPDLIDSFDYPNAEITDVIRAMSKLTGKNFVIDPGVRGKITVIAPSQVTVAEAWKAFLSALAINGYTVVPSGPFLKVKPARDASRDAIETYSGSYFPNSDQLITRIVKLKYISADEANKQLRVLATKFGEMNPYPQTNSLIISDFGANIERITTILNELDQPGFEDKLEVIPIQHAKAKNISELIAQIINKGDSGGGAGGFSPANRFRSSLQPTGGGTSKGNVNESLSMVTPDERTNAIIVVGNDAGIQKIRSLVKKLDYPIDPSESGGVYVYYVKHGEAKTISQTLSGIAQEAEKSRDSDPIGGAIGGAGRFTPPAAKNQPIFGGDVKITADENTNSLVITASKQDYGVVLSLLERLDIAKDQVYVEAYIVEMNTADSNLYDVTYSQFAGGSNDSTATQSFAPRTGFTSSGNLADILNPASTSKGAILSFGAGKKIRLNVAGQQIEVPSLIGFLNFLKSYVHLNILSTPQIIALDNEDAEIEVGEEVPVAQQSTSVGVTTGGVQYKNATIKLKIKPFISPDTDVLRLNVEQSVKQVKNNVAVANFNAPSLSTRTVKTNIVLTSGETAVLGGLIQDQETITENKVPFLGDIPVLGWLFKGSSTKKEKVNLMVFLTPKVIRNPIEHRKLTLKKIDDRTDFIRRYGSGRDPHGRTFEEMRAQNAALANTPPPTAKSPAKLNVEPSKNELDLEDAPLTDDNGDDTIKFE